MSINEREYNYVATENDNLLKIAQKHEMENLTDAARKIWEDEKNKGLHKEARKNGNKTKRQIIDKEGIENDFDPVKYKRKESKSGYDDPSMIVLYKGEVIWIPNEKKTGKKEDGKEERIEHKMKDEELKKGFQSDQIDGKYKLIFPVMKVMIEKDDKEKNKDFDFILTGTNENGKEEYSKKLTNKDDKSVGGSPYCELHFQMTPKDLLYTLVCKPKDAKDKEGKKISQYTLFEKQPYSG